MKYIEVIPIVIYAIVGFISSVMAYKNLYSSRFLTFHEKASATSWDNLDKSLQAVILALMRVSGLGFLVTALLLLIFPVANFFIHDEFIKYLVPCISLIFCTGLFVVNFKLYKQTKSETPWKGSLYAVIFIIIGLIISMFN